MRGDVTDAGQPTKQQQLKIELLSQWKLDAESRNIPNNKKSNLVAPPRSKHSKQSFPQATNPHWDIACRHQFNK